jgi:hypothetical protein
MCWVLLNFNNGTLNKSRANRTKRKIFYTNINAFKSLTFIYGKIMLAPDITSAVAVRKQF